MHNFQPRGIIKWAPFAALNEYQNTVEQLKLELEQETNYRSPAFYEYIDEILSKVNYEDEMMVNFFENNEPMCEFGTICVLDEQTIEINNRKIHKGQISDIII